MTWTYLSHLINKDTPLYDGKGEVSIRQLRSISAGDSSNNTEVQMPVHAGTHVDTPFHFDQEGKTVDAYFADYWHVCNLALIDYPAVPAMILGMEHLQEELQKVPKNTDLLLIRTGIEKWRTTDPALYCRQGVGLGEKVAQWIRCNLYLRFIGLDCISVSSPMHREEGRHVHRVLLGKHGSGSEPILIIEDMALAHLQKVPQEAWIVPLRFQGADGAMVTILARIS